MRWAAAACAVLMIVAVGAAVTLDQWSRSSGLEILLGDAVDTQRVVGLLTLLAAVLLLLAIVFWTTQLRRSGLKTAVKVITGVLILVASIATVGWVFFDGDRNYTAVLVAGRETGVVAYEQSFLLGGSGELYQRDGLVLRPLGSFAADDGYQPIRTGDYDATWLGSSLTVHYGFDGRAAGRRTHGLTVTVTGRNGPAGTRLTPG